MLFSGLLLGLLVLASSSTTRSRAASVAALTRWSLQDGRAGTAKARRTWHDHWLEIVDPDNELPPAERERRADRARRAHMKRLSAKAAAARRRKARA